MSPLMSLPIKALSPPYPPPCVNGLGKTLGGALWAAPSDCQAQLNTKQFWTIKVDFV